MRRKAVVVKEVGVDEIGKTWCVLQGGCLSPGDSGWVGPFRVTHVQIDEKGRAVHILNPGADPEVGEVVALVDDTTDQVQLAA